MKPNYLIYLFINNSIMPPTSKNELGLSEGLSVTLCIQTRMVRDRILKLIYGIRMKN